MPFCDESSVSASWLARRSIGLLMRQATTSAMQLNEDTGADAGGAGAAAMDVDDGGGGAGGGTAPPRGGRHGSRCGLGNRQHMPTSAICALAQGMVRVRAASTGASSVTQKLDPLQLAAPLRCGRP